ncbi:hypothetical protein [Delftia phage PhiW-14]|uniref:Uncharacterized protein n=1 Tax=Delftia phage PhiW-14 TaxID=665032 RepID=C9DGG2_BPW14|nr:hypothetical protein DP-phiW-14_gp192 [Delftia phage PhiW-14]ACV50213.1 hypothetical protein [Delftia phage PhiW-14]
MNLIDFSSMPAGKREQALETLKGVWRAITMLSHQTEVGQVVKDDALYVDCMNLLPPDLWAGASFRSVLWYTDVCTISEFVDYVVRTEKKGVPRVRPPNARKGDGEFLKDYKGIYGNVFPVKPGEDPNAPGQMDANVLFTPAGELMTDQSRIAQQKMAMGLDWVMTGLSRAGRSE